AGNGVSAAAVALGTMSAVPKSSTVKGSVAASQWPTPAQASAAAAGLAWAGVAHWPAVVIPFFLFLFGTALIVPNATAAALSPFPASAGSASSLIGAIGFTAGALVSSLLGAAFDGTARPMASVAALAGAAAFTFEKLLLRGKA
ncbi:MAG TPA: hypothetical protein VJ797_08350, partial [Burkholderiales bacterium]|nr:hypothetical protein [Burkholderiales bacterium]